MDELDRRTFLANGLRAGAILAVGGTPVIARTISESTPGVSGDPSQPTERSPGRPGSLTTNGVVSPVGVDPDDVSFAWHVADTRRGAVQGAYRVEVVGPGTSGAKVWDSGEVASGRQAFVAYRGPSLSPDSRYQWRVATADAAGQWSGSSAPATFTTGLRGSDWAASWLRPGPAHSGVEAYTYLRSTRTLPAGDVAYAIAYVAAAHKYQLWVNGKKLDTGPSFCFPDEQYYQATDVTGALVPGRRNGLGILHHWYGPGRGRPSSAPGLLVHLSVHYTNGKTFTMGSDESWRSHRAEWLPAPQRNNDSGDFVEWIDGRRHPSGWAEAGFDDSLWAPAAVLGPRGTAPFARLYAQRTRIVEQSVQPLSVTTLPTGAVVVDFGKVYAGRPTVSFNGGRSGHTVPMHVGYTLDPDGSVSTTHNTQGTDLSFSYIQGPGAQTFEPYWYLGFRYLQIDDPGETIADDQVALVARHAAMPAGPVATFSSSDRTLDAVWELCAHSGLYTSQEQFVDTPTREKGQFLWDAANESQTVMRTYGEQNLTWQGLRDMTRAQARYWPLTGQMNEVYPNDDGPQDYPMFTALYPEWVWRYYLSTGDVDTATGILGSLSKLSDHLATTVDPATGLISGQPPSTNGDNTYGYDYDTVADTTLNILAVNAYRRIDALASLAGDLALASVQAQRATALAQAVNTRLVQSEGLYVDGLRAGGRQSTHTSQLANAAALAYDIVPSSGVATVASHVASLDISLEPDHGLELLRSLHAAGRDADVVRVLTDSSFPGWAAIVKSGGTFTWETWTPSDLIGDSMSHGWGSSALVAIQEVLLGAVPTPPQSDGAPTVLTVTPPSGGITHASGSFPTPAGEFSVSWRRTSAALSSLSIGIPPNAAALCRIPGAKVGDVVESGKPLAQVRGVRVSSTAGGTLTLAVGAGDYDFAIDA